LELHGDVIYLEFLFRMRHGAIHVFRSVKGREGLKIATEDLIVPVPPVDRNGCRRLGVIHLRIDFLLLVTFGQFYYFIVNFILRKLFIIPLLEGRKIIFRVLFVFVRSLQEMRQHFVGVTD
jgi:hypothetical protein